MREGIVLLRFIVVFIKSKYMKVVVALLCVVASWSVQRNAVDFPTIPPLTAVEAPKQDLTSLYKHALHQIASQHKDAWIAARGALPP